MNEQSAGRLLPRAPGRVAAALSRPPCLAARFPAARAGRGATGRAAACGDREQDEQREREREREREQSRKVERAGEEIFSNFYSTVRQS